jgi:RNA polymerase sigma-70 factor (ECF subfamily)
LFPEGLPGAPGISWRGQSQHLAHANCCESGAGFNRRLRFWNRTRAAAPEFDLVSQSLADRGASPEGAALAKERVAAVWSVVETLSQRQRTVFLLRFVEDLDLLEIAAVTGLREGTVKVHLFRALEAVRKRVGETQ